MELREEYKEIAERCIMKYPELAYLQQYPVEIVFLGSSKEKASHRKRIFGECTKVSKRYKWCCPYDFIITIYEPNCAEMTEEQLETLIRHELLHVGVEDTDDGDYKLYLNPHDVEDFEAILVDKGIGWATEPYRQTDVREFLRMADDEEEEEDDDERTGTGDT